MGLGHPLPGAITSQAFGPASPTSSGYSAQPAMWHYKDSKASWTKFNGATYNEHVHAGTDYAGYPAGMCLAAIEKGRVTRAEYDSINGGGWVVEVEIRPGTRYSYNHCQSLLVAAGDEVVRGQLIAGIGATGTIRLADGTFVRSTYGVHLHLVLLLHDGTRWFLWNVEQFMDGGSRADDPRVQPAT
jgi:murein DD-endopeptidase MepM/ murein hydrolase activator NlpD